MAENTEKNKSGAGKFFLGALLGGIAGAIAGKFIKLGDDGGEEVEEGCNCEGRCDCKEKEAKKETKPAAEKAAKK
ncbi:hypothetical protein IKF67_03070 [Candidatus Saccharibacteria bacterium]|nr:hypothetical protein [Candidatus Saccharibacteria bacterium]